MYKVVVVKREGELRFLLPRIVLEVFFWLWLSCLSHVLNVIKSLGFFVLLEVLSHGRNGCLMVSVLIQKRVSWLAAMTWIWWISFCAGLVVALSNSSAYASCCSRCNIFLFCCPPNYSGSCEIPSVQVTTRGMRVLTCDGVLSTGLGMRFLFCTPILHGWVV